MRVLEQLEPQGVFRFFEELCAIPHGSRNCQAVSDWCAAFARERGLECHQDQAGNVIIIQEATPGYEAAAPVILQGHLDMVCEKEPGCTKDMAGEGLDLLVEDGCVRAKGTTLGGDDGIAVAMALAILDDQAIPHPRLEVVLTTDEEIGMLGAEALDAAPLRGRKLINVDSEEEGIFTVSCAGGSMAQCTLPVTRAPYDGAVLEVTVRGLTGGHSGTEIHKGRANACVLLGRLLQAMAEQTELRLVTAAGGGKDNAIAVEASAQVVVSDDAVARQAADLVRLCGHGYSPFFAASTRLVRATRPPSLIISWMKAGNGCAWKTAPVVSSVMVPVSALTETTSPSEMASTASGHSRMGRPMLMELR